jgi:hydroxyacylglutathione hydrolase
MKLIPLPALADNYIWMLHNAGHALVVDPGDAQPVLDALQRYGLKLQAILVTHHHADHTAGIAALVQQTGAAVYGPAGETITAEAQGLAEGDVLTLLGMNLAVIDVPGHTAGHIAYYAQLADDAPLLFCGDTLFSAGCGRIFEGTPAQMLASLDKLAALPETTRVCCTHEYTLSNLRFALEVEPANAALLAHARHCQQLRSQDRPTLPSSIGLEKRINPFLRSREATVAAAALRHDLAYTEQHGSFACLREWKNTYR